MAHRVRVVAGLWALAEVVVFALVAVWIGVAWTLLAALATTVLGWTLMARQMKDLAAPLRSPARGGTLQRGRLATDAGLVAAGGVLMVLPGFLGDVVGLLCLLPGTRTLVRRALARLVLSRLPDRMRGPVRTRSVRVEQVGDVPGSSGSTRARPLVIEGEVLREPDDRP